MKWYLPWIRKYVKDGHCKDPTSSVPPKNYAKVALDRRPPSRQRPKSRPGSSSKGVKISKTTKRRKKINKKTKVTKKKNVRKVTKNITTRRKKFSG